MRTITLVAAFVALALSGEKARAQPTEDMSANPIIREYRSKLPLLVERYSTNRKIRSRLTRYVTNPKAGEKVGDVEVSALAEVILDGRQIKSVALESKPERFKDVVQFWRPDMRFEVVRLGTTFKLTNQQLASGNYNQHELERYWFFAHEPIRSGGYSGTTLWFDTRGHKAAVVSVLDVKPASRVGKGCIEVRTKWDNLHGMTNESSTFLNPANDYIAIAAETDWRTDSQKKEYQTIQEVEYQPSSEGYPLPKRSLGLMRYRDGSVRKMVDVEFLSYERYVPSPEEFQLEKPYGLVTPAEVPIAQNTALVPPAKQRRWWPWIVLGAGTVLAVVAVLLMRKTRRRESAASTAIGNPTP